MSMNVFWGDRQEYLAEALYASWDADTGGDPFTRICVVVGEPATRTWLQDYFLKHRRPGRRRILANVDFKPLAEFANDWLAAQTHGAESLNRRPAEHPYAKGVLAWRIDALLREHEHDPDFRVLASYVARGSGRVAARRRFELATRLAEMYDDYLASRHPMLLRWERGDLPTGSERWQALLYRMLAEQAPETYARDYARALAPSADPARAFENGFPRYRAVHVFDVSSAPWPYLRMLERLAAVLPVVFWNFNPSRAFWLDDPTKRQLFRDRAAALRKALEAGETPPEETTDEMFGSPDRKLLGALATGVRGVLSAELDFTDGDCAWIGGEEDNFASLRRLTPEVHVCHSPRRELEAARDALHRFFAENADARPCDALVLCADWDSYAPLIEAVFGVSGERDFPVVSGGLLREATPLTHSVGDLLDFRTNRFEVTKVFGLLGVPEIRRTFGIDADGLSVLRDMVRGNNLHWGFDEADVRALIGAQADEGGPFPFTWSRGLDRFTLDALLGPRADESTLSEAGRLGAVMPLGHVESERARLVGALGRFVRALAGLRRFLQGAHTAEEWRDRLLQALDDFYDVSEEDLAVFVGVRRAVASVASEAIVARTVSGRAAEQVPGDVFCKALLSAVQEGARRIPSAGDAVRFAPLTAGAAAPARFVWICGLNDGAFPRSDFRPSFDLIGRHPTMFDVSARERDTFAFLKAALGARDRLAFSYTGRDARTNEEIPATVPLADLLDWCAASGVETRIFHHPLQAFSPRYFLKPEKPGDALPPSYSAADRDAAAALLASSATGAEEGRIALAPFAAPNAGPLLIDVDELASFYARPNRFLARNRLDIRLAKSRYDELSNDDDLDESLPGPLQKRLTIRGKTGIDIPAEARALVEAGKSLTPDELASAIDRVDGETEPYRTRRIKYVRALADGFTCVGLTAAEALAAWEDRGVSTSYHADFAMDVPGAGPGEGSRTLQVTVGGSCRTIALDVQPSGRLAHAFAFSPYGQIYDSLLVEAWIRHVAGHAAGETFVTAMMCLKDGPVRTYRPIPRDEALDELRRIVRQALEPMVFDIRKTDGPDDTLPGEFAEAVARYRESIVSTHGR